VSFESALKIVRDLVEADLLPVLEARLSVVSSSRSSPKKNTSQELSKYL